MTEFSRRFNFDDFDDLCREALDERLLHESEQLEEESRWADHDRVFYPGEIGGVICRLSLTTDPELPPSPSDEVA